MAKQFFNEGKLFWGELSSEEFARLDTSRTIAILPVAAIEQHGPHLPVGVDTLIATGMVGEVARRFPVEISALFLPVQAVGKSNEHLAFPGTLTLTAETALRAWIEIGESIHRAGIRKLVIVTSHGGNVDVIGIVARELRVRFNMLVVKCGWSGFGNPPGLYSPDEEAMGIHAGDMETSLMLHFRPDLVKMQRAENFVPATARMREDFLYLRPTGPQAFGWMAGDVHPSGAMGDASRATREKGRATAEYQALAFLDLLRDVDRFDIARLASAQST